MNFKQYKKQIDKEIVDPLVEIRNEEDDCGFCTRQVMILRKKLLKYTKKTLKIKNADKEKISKNMRKLIRSLNRLNTLTDYCMLEDEMGENVISVIESVAFEAGYPETNADITKVWRKEW